MEAFIYTLIAAALSALAWIAYNHPDGYKRIHWPIQFIAMAIMAITITYSIGVGQGYVSTLPYLQPGKMDIAQKAADAREFDSNITAPAFAALMFYINILYWLHEILGDKRKD